MTTPSGRTTVAFYAQSALSFGVALVALVLGVLYLDADPWVKSFLALGALYLVTSTFTLAKVVRDQDEQGTFVSRVDQARVDKLLAQHDPFSEHAA